MKNNYNSEIEFIHIEEGEKDDENTTLWLAILLENGLQKSIEYQYDNNEPCQYGYNIYEFDPTLYKNLFK